MRPAIHPRRPSPDPGRALRETGLLVRLAILDVVLVPLAMRVVTRLRVPDEPIATGLLLVAIAAAGPPGIRLVQVAGGDITFANSLVILAALVPARQGRGQATTFLAARPVVLVGVAVAGRAPRDVATGRCAPRPGVIIPRDGMAPCRAGPWRVPCAGPDGRGRDG